MRLTIYCAAKNHDRCNGTIGGYWECDCPSPSHNAEHVYEEEA